MEDETAIKRKIRILNDVKERLCDMTILVEGVHDIRALEIAGMGSMAEIIAISGRKPEEICETLGGRKVAIMTDFDRNGQRMATRLEGEFLAHNALPDISCRNDLRRILGLNTIEDLPTALTEFEKKVKV